MITLFSLSDTDVNDRDFITNLYETYGKTMWKYAYKLSANYDTANDIVSIVFITIIEKVDLLKKIHRGGD